MRARKTFATPDFQPRVVYGYLAMELTNNNVLRRVRYTFDLDDAEMIRVFGLGGQTVSRAQVSDWLKRDNDEAFVPLDDFGLATFLNGFIIKRRGRREGPQPKAESELTNNIILVKLRIALKLQADDVLELICGHELEFSRHELSALFRKPDHKHYRECLNQVLRNFLDGMQAKYRKSEAASESE
ncbi:MAG: DUF1456 family protein [Polyangiales bacterium]